MLRRADRTGVTARIRVFRRDRFRYDDTIDRMRGFTREVAARARFLVIFRAVIIVFGPTVRAVSATRHESTQSQLIASGLTTAVTRAVNQFRLIRRATTAVFVHARALTLHTHVIFRTRTDVSRRKRSD